jgi:hypothetical protein
MGGMGSGYRWRASAKAATEDYRALDVRRIARAGILMPGSAREWQWSRDGKITASVQMHAKYDRIILTYRHRTYGGAWQNENYPVLIARSECPFGGSRPWFICPAKGCGRRVAILYCVGIFACRHCCRLVYASTREDEADRVTRRADRIRSLLGWKPGVFNGPGDKPKWMRQRTFARLTTRHDAYLAQTLRALSAKAHGY